MVPQTLQEGDWQHWEALPSPGLEQQKAFSSPTLCVFPVKELGAVPHSTASGAEWISGCLNFS